jgi:hypothetical protein
MTITIIVLIFLACFSLLSSIIVLAALVRSSQFSDRDESVEQGIGHAWEPEPKRVPVPRSETTLAAKRLYSTSKRHAPNQRDRTVSQEFIGLD